jgi:phosphoribosylanthranilate isomerase
VLHWREKHTQAIRERDALQLHLNAAEQRIDELAGLLRRCLMSVREQHCDQDEADFDLPTDLMADIDAQLPASTEAEQDDDWRMNPCKQGHRDVGAAGGVAHCYQCDEKIEAATTQEAFERWNATHPKQ